MDSGGVGNVESNSQLFVSLAQLFLVYSVCPWAERADSARRQAVAPTTAYCRSNLRGILSCFRPD